MSADVRRRVAPRGSSWRRHVSPAHAHTHTHHARNTPQRSLMPRKLRPIKRAHSHCSLPHKPGQPLRRHRIQHRRPLHVTAPEGILVLAVGKLQDRPRNRVHQLGEGSASVDSQNREPQREPGPGPSSMTHAGCSKQYAMCKGGIIRLRVECHWSRAALPLELVQHEPLHLPARTRGGAHTCAGLGRSRVMQARRTGVCGPWRDQQNKRSLGIAALAVSTSCLGLNTVVVIAELILLPVEPMCMCLMRARQDRCVTHTSGELAAAIH